MASRIPEFRDISSVEERYATCGVPNDLAKRVESAIQKHSRENGLNPTLVRARICQESSFDAKAKNKSTILAPIKVLSKTFLGRKVQWVYGLCQLSEDNCRKYIGKDWKRKWMIPEENIRAGCRMEADMKLQLAGHTKRLKIQPFKSGPNAALSTNDVLGAYAMNVGYRRALANVIIFKSLWKLKAKSNFLDNVLNFHQDFSRIESRGRARQRV